MKRPTMPHIDHVAIWVTDLDGARDFYSHWFNGHAVDRKSVV